jgi:hypothetical protein
VEGALLRVQVEHLPGDRSPKPLWLWTSTREVVVEDLAGLFFAFCRRFDIEHTFRFWKLTLDWTRPRIRPAASRELWTWLVIAAYTQLHLARPWPPQRLQEKGHRHTPRRQQTPENGHSGGYHHPNSRLNIQLSAGLGEPDELLSAAHSANSELRKTPPAAGDQPLVLGVVALDPGQDGE